MISVLLNLLRLVLWPRIWLIFVYVLRELEKTMYSANVGWNVVENVTKVKMVDYVV